MNQYNTSEPTDFHMVVNHLQPISLGQYKLVMGDDPRSQHQETFETFLRRMGERELLVKCLLSEKR